MIEIPLPLVAAFAAGPLATIGAHIGIVRALRPPGEWHLDKPAVGLALYGLGAVMCAVLTYTAWCELSPPASVAVSAAWGIAHPVATMVLIYVLQKRAPGLAKRIRDEHEDGGP